MKSVRHFLFASLFLVSFTAEAFDQVATQWSAFSVLSQGLESNTSRPGNDFANFSTTDAMACQKACAASGFCRAFTFVKSSRECLLKHAPGNSIGDPDCISGVQPASSPLLGEATIENKYDVEVQLQLLCSAPATYYRDFPAETPGECQKACVDDYRCKAYDWTPQLTPDNPKPPKCGLKESVSNILDPTHCTSGEVLTRPLPTGEGYCYFLADLCTKDCGKYIGNPQDQGACVGGCNNDRINCVNRL
jgi:hypothetical protein